MGAREVSGATTSAGPATVERASPSDRAFLAMDTGPVPGHIGAVLELDGGITLAEVRNVVAARVEGVPRLRQRLVPAPFGCGGPVWVDHATFDVAQHVGERQLGRPADEDALLRAALDVVMTPLRRDRPLWRLVLVGGQQHGRSALVVVLHHALADGVGGLAVLAGLVDPGVPTPGHAFPRPRPEAAELLRDSIGAKAGALQHLPASWRLLRASFGAGGGLHPRPVAACSLTRPTGPRRRMAVVRTAYPPVRSAAHRLGATTNAAVLVAVAGALRRVLEARGERIGPISVTVPVSGRPTEAARTLGNLVSPLLVGVPTEGPVERRLAEVAAAVRAGRAAATGPPPIALLGWAFRPLARVGGYRWFMNHQRRFHTLVSHVRGPAEPVWFGGRRVISVVPLGVSEAGNCTVYFEVLSYAGTLTVAIFVDPDHVPELHLLTAAVETELRAIVQS